MKKKKRKEYYSIRIKMSRKICNFPFSVFLLIPIVFNRPIHGILHAAHRHEKNLKLQIEHVPLSGIYMAPASDIGSFLNSHMKTSHRSETAIAYM